MRNRGSFLNGTWCKGSLAAGILILAAACSGDSPTESSNINSPIVPTGNGPIAFGVGEAGNGLGACMKNDVDAANALYEPDLTPGEGPLNCTSNDISIARATVTKYSFTGEPGSFVTLAPGGSIQCNEGQTIYAETNAELQSTANERYDVGVWIAADGGDALTGSCRHFNLILASDGVSDLDGDVCGDMESETGAAVISLDTLELSCSPNDDGFVEVGACIGWQNQVNTNQGAPRVCTETFTPEQFRFATVPDNKAKCNCDPFVLPIIVNESAKLEIQKVCVPTSIPGATFDLLIDGNVEADNAACGGTTGEVIVGAGTNQVPGATHTFSEGDFTTADYTTAEWECHYDGGAEISSGTGVGPHNIAVEPDDDIICVFTNTKKASLKIIKDASPNSAQDFDFDGTGTGISADIDLDDDADGTLPNFALFSQLTPGGTRTVTETAVAGWTLTDISCTGATNSTVTIGASGGFTAGDNSVSVVLAPGEDVVCTFTNTRHGVTVSKTATETFKRGFAWGIDKTANPAGPIDLDPGQIYSQDYDIAVDTVGYTDSAFAVSGNITITNPNAFAVTINSVTDAITGVGAVTVQCPQTLPYSLAGGGNLVCTYESALPDGSTRTNTASVTLDGIADPFTDDESVTFVGASPSSYQNNCLAVSDVWNGGAPEAIGTVCVTGTPHSAGAQTAPHTFDMDKEIPTGPAQCGQVTYNNTATGTTNTSGTEVSDDASVVVNIECPQGCTLTQGYWKTHNQSFRDARNGRGPAPDDAWLLIGVAAEDTPFYLSGQTWFQVFWTAPKGNAYYNLAHQYMAAKLNVLDGVDASTTIDGYIAEAEGLFATYTPAQIAAKKPNDAVRQRFIELAGYLGAFNEGLAGVDHCTEDETSRL